MNNARRYDFEGISVDIPLRYDEASKLYIEDYPDFVENPIWTREGHPVMFSAEDACSLAVEETEGGCPDCASCIYYRSAGEHTWFGVCINEEKRKKN